MSATVNQQSEKDLQQAVLDLAAAFRWDLGYHTFDSRHSAAGFLDLVLVRGKRIIFAELKTETGKVSERQQEWIWGVRANGHVEVYVWRPSDWAAIEATLR